MRRTGALLALPALLVCASCGPAREGAHEDAPATVAADAPSITALEVAITDQDGQAATLADLRGRVWVVAMMYSACETVCPRVTEDMKAIERQVSAAGSDESDAVRFALFSLDAEHESPAALREYARDHRLDPARWRLFTADEDGVRDLAAVFGVRYKPDGEGEIAHSAMILVLDRRGAVVHRQVGVDQDATALIAALAEARR